MNWTRHTLVSGDISVKIYVNSENTQVVVFPNYGKVFKLSSDTGALDFATTFIFAKNNNVISFWAYTTRNEETALIAA
jgi:hypothetical protein